VAWHLVQISHAVSSSDYVRAVRLVEEPGLTLRLLDVTPEALRWRTSATAEAELAGDYDAERLRNDWRTQWASTREDVHWQSSWTADTHRAQWQPHSWGASSSGDWWASGWQRY
jgi:hypothetical protein